MAAMEFKLPDIGEGVHEGEIVRWLVKAGDVVKVDQPLVEVMTDKATVEIPTSQAGKIEKILAAEGTMVKVGQAIALLSDAGASASAVVAPAPAKPAAAAPAAPTKPAVASTPQRAETSMAAVSVRESVSYYVAEPGRVLASPATRRLARELGVSLESLTGTGPGGRVTKDDLQKGAAGSVAPRPGMGAPVTSTRSDSKVTTPLQRPLSPLQSGPRETVTPLRGVRRKIAEGMRKSKDTAAHFTYVDECDLTELVQFRAEMKKLAEEKGIKLTYLPFLIKAVIQALRKYPMLNSSLDDAKGEWVLKNYFNIGIAVDTDEGLMVPVIKDADKKTILELAYEIQILAEKAQQKRLSVDDLKGGTFTITNAGTIGGLFATPIINHPEVAILGFNKIAKRPHVKGDQIVVAHMTWFSISIDHRVVDGATGARFMNEFMSSLAQPKRLMLDMI